MRQFGHIDLNYKWVHELKKDNQVFKNYTLPSDKCIFSKEKVMKMDNAFLKQCVNK